MTTTYVRLSGRCLCRAIAACSLLAISWLELAVAQTSTALVSDDFHSPALNDSLWTFENPKGDATLIATGAHVRIAVPAGVSHDVWTDGVFAPHLKQSAPDTDFEIVVKFESPVNRMYQLQGILIEQDADNFMRFDFHSDGSRVRVFTAAFRSGQRSVKGNRAIAETLPLHMRVTRAGHTWTQAYSYDGQNWLINTTFEETISVTSAGAFAGNSGVQAPAFTAVIDYFFNTAAPIAPEDDGQHTVTVNLTGEGSVNRLPNKPAYLSGETVTLEALPSSGLFFHSWSGDLSGNANPAVLQMSDDRIINAIFTANDLPNIAVWYGDHQSFGHNGTPQKWVNVLGTVSDYDGLSSFTYSLNGAAAKSLSTGPGNPRLVRTGDFNVELPFSSLLNGENELIVTATDRLGNVSTRIVTLNVGHDSVWPLPDSIEWSTANQIDEAAQVVDGLWNLQDNEVRTLATGYDRLIAIGDTTWKDYEVTVPITIHGFDTLGSGAIVGLLLRWDGHDDWGGNQPVIGWWPMGAIGAYQPQDANNNTGTLKLIGDNSVVLAQTNRKLDLGVPYLFKMRVETIHSVGSLYQLKVWRENEPEPTAWDLAAQEGLSDPPRGSLLLAAHHTDASFGNVSIVPVIKEIDNLETIRDETSTIVRWITPEPATGFVAYGRTTAYESGLVSSSVNASEHEATLSGLAPATRYHYRIMVVTSAGDTVRSEDLGFRTLAPSILVSDHFDGPELDQDLWQLVDPSGEATLAMTGNQLALTVPAGSAHDVWTNIKSAPRVMQPANDSDFEIDVKFVSSPASAIQLQGILIEEDSTNFLRFDFHHNGSGLRIFAASFVNGRATARVNIKISNGMPLHMRIGRVGDEWTQCYSFDGSSWTVAGSFIHVLQVHSAGIFAGNGGAQPPAFTALADYFSNNDLPAIDSKSPRLSNVAVSVGDTSATISWRTDEPANSHVAYGRDHAYQEGYASSSALVTEHTIVVTGLAPETVYHFLVSSSDETGNTACWQDSTFRTASISAVAARTVNAPLRFELQQNYPNPFNPATTIAFSVPNPGFATVKIFNSLGEEVATAFANEVSAGFHSVVWFAGELAGGVYFYRLTLEPSGLSETRKLLLVK